MSDVADVADKAQATEAAVDYVATYLALKDKIGRLEAEAAEAREAVGLLLRGKPGTVWEFPGLGQVAVVKGRVSEKLDRAKLARAGVSAEVLDAATIRTEGEPSLRISAAKAEAA